MKPLTYDGGTHRRKRATQGCDSSRRGVRRANKASQVESRRVNLSGFPVSIKGTMPSRSPNWIDLKSVRQSISLETLLSHYNIDLRRIGSNVLRGRCPLPSHDPQKKAASFIVNLTKNVWSCHSQGCASERGGKIGGNALDFVAAMERCSILEAGKKIQEWATTMPSRPPAPERPQPEQGREVNRPLQFTLRGVDSSHPYLTDRSIKPDTAAAFGIGYYGQAGLMQGRIAIPIHNEQGQLVAYAGRSIDDREPRYRFPRGFHKSLELYNLHRAVKTKGREVIVVEGFFDCLQVHQAGFPNVVALMGTTLSEAQLNTLAVNFESAVLMLDDDGPGRAASVKVADQLGRRMAVRVITPPEGKQPDQLSATELKRIISVEQDHETRRNSLKAQETVKLAGANEPHKTHHQR